MFGKNPISKIDLAPADGKLAVQEIFYTLQGEGPLSGRPAVFIRLAGCHLACSFCDTEFSTGINNRLTPEEVVAQALATLPDGVRPGLVVLTGGEPMRQATGRLLTLLQQNKFRHVQFETAGNLWDPSAAHFLDQGFATLVVSPKVPHIHPQVVRRATDYKYIISHDDVSPEDGLPMSGTQASSNRGRPMRPWDLDDHDVMTELELGLTTIWVSPCDAHDLAVTLKNMHAAKSVALKHGYRLSLQIHKILGLE